uniref:non-specific protein-tyrosine kinase n=2 Tax=Clastoptera arizonana TaxID=38151 RepID=A0A1B6DNP3_9HEMI
MDYSKFIKVYDIFSPEPNRLAIDKQTRAEDVTIELCQKLKIKPITRHLFSLKFYNTKEWVSPAVKLIDSKIPVFELRLRFKVPDFLKLLQVDIEAYNYYFHQVRSDVLNNKVADLSYDKYKRELLGMGVADMYRVILETGVSRCDIESDYKKYIPKEVLKHHRFFVKRPIHDTLNSIENGAKKGRHDSWYVKKEYLKQFEDLAPNYLCEEFTASIDEANSIRPIVLKVNPYDKDFPGVKYLHDSQKQIHHLCSIEDLCFITVRSDGTIEIARKNGVPIYLKFGSILTMFSFVSLLDGYYRLAIKWTFNLSKDLLTPSLEKLYMIKCHGPVGGEFSYQKLEKMRNCKPGCYILRESEMSYNQYYLDVCTKNSTKPTTYKIDKLIGAGFIFNEEEKIYNSLQEILIELREAGRTVYLSECIPPSEYDVSPLLLCRSDQSHFDGNDDETLPLALPSSPQIINTKELQIFKGRKKECKGNMTTVYQGVWRRKKRRKVDIALKVFKPENKSDYVDELLEMMGHWSSIQSPAIVRIYGITLNSPLGMVLEYLPFGPLDVYLQMNGRYLKEVDLVEAANYLATALWNLEEVGIVHGNVRCHKLLVAARTDTSFVVRLSDPGLTRIYTDHDIHWLAPECYPMQTNAHTTQAADVWSLGTSLWEIFSKGQTPSIPDVHNLKEFYLSGKRLPLPRDCSMDIYQLMLRCWNADAQRRKKTQEVMRDVNHLLYQVFNSRRIHSYSTALPKNKSVSSLDLNSDSTSISIATSQTTISSDLTLDVSITGDCNMNSTTKQTSWGESEWLIAATQELYQCTDVHCPDISAMMSQLDLSSDTTSLDSVTSLQGIFELEGDCNVVLQGRIGQGFYGEVYKGSLEQLDKDTEPQLVAVKKLKSNSLSASLQDFEREIDIMKKLKHENIVQIKGVIQEPEVSLVMEFVPHGSLQCYLKINHDRLKPKNLLTFAMDVAKGMEYLGQKNIVHRDLAARNILVCSDSQVKISDFGLAQVMGSNNYYILKTNRELPIKWSVSCFD